MKMRKSRFPFFVLLLMLAGASLWWWSMHQMVGYNLKASFAGGQFITSPINVFGGNPQVASQAKAKANLFRNLAWSVFAGELVGLFWCVRWWRRRASYPKGRCQTCDYDLTGNISGICPECGNAIPRIVG